MACGTITDIISFGKIAITANGEQFVALIPNRHVYRFVEILKVTSLDETVGKKVEIQTNLHRIGAENKDIFTDGIPCSFFRTEIPATQSY